MEQKTIQTTGQKLDYIFGTNEAYKVIYENEEKVRLQTRSMVNFRDFEDAKEVGLKFYQVHATTDKDTNMEVLELIFKKIA